MHYPFTLGKVADCGGAASLPLRSLAKGTYSFKYVVEKVSLLTSVLGAVTGCSKNTVTPTQDQLGTLTKDNVKVTDNAVYSGTIVVAVHPPAGGIGIQVPSQSISVKVGPVHTSVNLPGATVGVPNPIPGITPTCPSRPARWRRWRRQRRRRQAAHGPGGGVNYTPPALTVPQKVMPHAVELGGGSAAVRRAGRPARGAASAATSRAGAARATATAAPPTTRPTSPTPRLSEARRARRQQRRRLFGKQLPVLLAIARDPGAVAGDRGLRPDGTCCAASS